MNLTTSKAVIMLTNIETTNSTPSFSDFIFYAPFSFWSDKKYSIDPSKYLAKRFKLSKLGSDLPDFQFEKAVWLIPVSFDT